MRIIRATALGAVAFVLASCGATTEERAITGGAIGATAGGVGAAAVDAPVGLGIVAGGIAGALIGATSEGDGRNYSRRHDDNRDYGHHHKKHYHDDDHDEYKHKRKHYDDDD